MYRLFHNGKLHYFKTYELAKEFCQRNSLCLCIIAECQPDELIPVDNISE